MKKIFLMHVVLLLVIHAAGCAIKMPDVIRSSEIMPNQSGSNDSVETIFPVNIEQFQDNRVNKRSVGYNINLDGTSDVVVDRDIASIIEDIVRNELSSKGVRAGNSIFTLKGIVQRTSIGNMPFSSSKNSIMGELSVETTITNTRKNTIVWSKTFAGQGAGSDYKTVLAQALSNLSDSVRKDDSVLKVRDIYAAALLEQPPERSTYVSKRLKKKKKIESKSAEAKSDVDMPPQTKVIPKKNFYAVVIGIEEYRQKLPKADYAVHDAKVVTEYLTRTLGYPEENVVTMTNEHAAMGDFVKYFEKWLSNNVEKDSSVFIYYSGHGAPNPKTGDAYLVPYDGDPSFIEQTGYPLRRLYSALEKLPAREIVLAMDACFSGAGGKSVLAKGARPLVMNIEQNLKPTINLAVLSASSGDQISSTYEEKGHGLFTYFMLKGIKNRAATLSAGGIDIGELFAYIKPQVERTARKTYNNEQSPQLIAPPGKKIYLGR